MSRFGRVRLVRNIGVTLLAFALVASACGDDDDDDAETGGTDTPSTDTGSPDTEAESSGDEEPLVIARDMDVNSLDPALAFCDTCQIYMTAVYETLLGLDPADNATLVPRLATEWSSNEDQTEFTFTLDPAAKFADGTALTSADVKFSWERLKGLEGSPSFLAASIETIETPDPQTVVVTLTSSNSAFLAAVNAPYFGITNSALATANGATTDAATDSAEPWFLENSAGSGPFVLESYAAGNELRLARNDAYWGTPSEFPSVIFKQTADAVGQRQQLEQGAVDIAMQISADVAAGISGDDVVIEQVPSFNFVYLGLSPGAVGGDVLTPEVREAIGLALDYDGLIDVTVGGAGRPQPSPIPNGFLGTENLEPRTQDLDRAKQLMADAGVTELTLDATYPGLNVYGVDFSTAMQKVQSDLKEIGINLELNPAEFSVWVDKVILGDGSPVTMIYYAPDYTDPSQYVQYFGLVPESRWLGLTKLEESAEQTELLAEAFATQDVDARAKLYEQLAEAMMSDEYIFPIVNPDLFLAYRSDISGMHYSACCNLDLAKLSRD